MTKRDGGPAFPRIDGLEQGDPGRTDVICTPGMTLRDYFAGQALAGLTAQVSGVKSRDDYALYVAQSPIVAYQIADAMLAARAHPEGEDDDHE